eukprot:m51a1_g1077 hypothetical protein (231) ;mRNA; f:8152-9118
MSVLVALLLLAAVASAQSRVQVTLVQESLCPGCEEYIKEDLGTLTSAEGLWDIIDLRIIPWGNAYVETTLCPSRHPGSYDVNVRTCWNSKCAGPEAPVQCFLMGSSNQTCQHGKSECVGNRIEGCANAHAPDQKAAYTFIRCFEVDHGAKQSAAEKCASVAGIDWSLVSKCVSTPEGDDVDIENARMTNELGPHQGTPWPYINGKPYSGSNLLKDVCAAYSGAKPAGCRK